MISFMTIIFPATNVMRIKLLKLCERFYLLTFGLLNYSSSPRKKFPATNPLAETNTAVHRK